MLAEEGRSRRRSPGARGLALRGRGLEPGRRGSIGPEKPATRAFPVWGGHGFPLDNSVFKSFKMVVAKSEACKAATVFRPASPSLGEGSVGARFCACASAGCPGL